MMSARLGSLVLLLALAGCQNTGAGGTVHPQLPLLPYKAKAVCARPAPARLNDDLGVLATRWKATAICEGGKRATIIQFYDDLRARFGK